jgi:hypothetical protein
VACQKVIGGVAQSTATGGFKKFNSAMNSLSVGVTGVVGACAYFAFNNFHKQQRPGASHD